MSRHTQFLTCGLCGVLAMTGIGCSSGQPAAAQAQPAASAPQAEGEAEPVDATAEKAGDAEASPYVDLTSPPRNDRAAEEQIRQAFEKPVTVDFKDESLEKAVGALAEKGGFKIRIDKEALAEEGIAPDEPITLSLPEATRLRSALQIMLEPLGLTVVVKGNAAVLTTEISAEEMLAVRRYSIHRLLEAGLSLHSTKEVILHETSGPWMEIDGTGGRITPLGIILSISQTDKVHGEIDQIIASLEGVIGGPETSGVALLHTTEDAAVSSLGRKVTLSLDDVPLSQLPEKLHEAAGVKFVINRDALAEKQIALDSPISIHVDDVPLRSALRQALEPLSLTCVPFEGILQVTTMLDADERHQTFLYNVRDLFAASYDGELLAELIQSSTTATWMEGEGYGGSIQILEPGFLLIRNTLEVHEATAALFAETREALRKSSLNGRIEKSIAADDLSIEHYKMAGTKIPFLGIDGDLRADQARDAILTFVAPESWKANGGDGEIVVVNSMLVVRQTDRVHRKIRRFIETLRWEAWKRWQYPFNFSGGTGLPGGSGFFSVP